MRIMLAMAIPYIIAGCASAAPPHVTTTTAAVASQPSASPSFASDIPVGLGRGAAGAMPPAGAPDPIATDGDKYRVILENNRVRVLRYQDRPGDKTRPHHHVEFVLYALSSFRRRLIFPDGSVRERDFNPGDVIWMPDQIHTGENIGTTNTDVVIVENKLAAGVRDIPAPPTR
jgi:beta-alanine degradation protein BauB